MVFSIDPLEACLIDLELPQKLLICSDVSGELWSFRKLLDAFFIVSPETVSYPYGSSRKFKDMNCSGTFIKRLKRTLCLYIKIFKRPFLEIFQCLVM